MYMKCEISINVSRCTRHMTFPKYNITAVYSSKFHSKFPVDFKFFIPGNLTFSHDTLS